MILERLSRTERRTEIRRLEGLKDDFMKDYLAVCEKYRARLSPVLGAVGENMIRLSMSLDVYVPEQEMADHIARTTKEVAEEKPEEEEPVEPADNQAVPDPKADIQPDANIQPDEK